MKSNKIIVAIFLSISFSIQGQAQSTVGVTHSGQSTGQTPFPVDTYAELPNPATTDPALWKNVKGTSVSWGSTDIRYKKEEPAPVGRISKEIELTAWKGERVASQWVVWGDQPLHSLSFSVTELVHKNKKSKIGQDRLLSGFVRYVMTDELNKDGMGGCGSRPDAAAFDSSLVADPIDHLTKVLSLPERTTQGGWVRVWVPQDSPAGIYEGKVILKDGDKTLGELILEINVKDRILPMPSEWTYHLDLWQNPFAIARYHQVEPWSKAHFDCMRPYMEMYRQAGGKVITASIMHKPWNGQTYDYFETMITWMKKADGSWSFDYTVFDRWIEFMMSVGVTQEINCYSMVPWRLSFQYFDQATNSLKFIDMKPGDLEYEDIWGTMLRSFAAHLKEKGWLSGIMQNEAMMSPEERMIYETFGGRDTIINNLMKQFDSDGDLLNANGVAGMDVTGKGTSWQQLTSVSEEYRQKMFDNVKKEFIQENGLSNGDTTKRSDIFKDYQLSVSKDKRLSGTWTLEQYEGQYRAAMYAAVKSANPNWKPGQKFDTSILDNVTRESVESTLVKNGNRLVRNSIDVSV